MAAEIAAVAGPTREINNHLRYLYELYPDRLVEGGYVDLGGSENARVVRGTLAPASSLQSDIGNWPSYPQGMQTPQGEAWIGRPFMSPTAHVEVVAATAPVVADGRVRAYVELELAMSAIRHVLESDVEGRVSVEVADHTGARLTGYRARFPWSRGAPEPGLLSAAGWRFAVRPVPEQSGPAGQWFVIAAARSPSGVSLAGVGPAQAAILGLAILLLGAAFLGPRVPPGEGRSREGAGWGTGGSRGSRAANPRSRARRRSASCGARTRAAGIRAATRVGRDAQRVSSGRLP